MNIARILSSSAVVAALGLTLVGCNQNAEEAKKIITVDKERSVNTEVCNTAPWIRDHAPAGLCETTPAIDDNMSLRRLHEELERSGR